MKVGDLVKRCSTGKIDLVIDVILDASEWSPTHRLGFCERGTEGEWVLLAGNQRLVYASNYEVISESR